MVTPYPLNVHFWLVCVCAQFFPHAPGNWGERILSPLSHQKKKWFAKTRLQFMKVFLLHQKKTFENVCLCVVNDECSSSWYSRVGDFLYQFRIGEKKVCTKMDQHVRPMCYDGWVWAIYLFIWCVCVVVIPTHFWVLSIFFLLKIVRFYKETPFFKRHD